jgi:hypothetical protein
MTSPTRRALGQVVIVYFAINGSAVTAQDLQPGRATFAEMVAFARLASNSATSRALYWSIGAAHMIGADPRASPRNGAMTTMTCWTTASWWGASSKCRSRRRAPRGCGGRARRADRAPSARLRADARGCDGGVRQVVAAHRRVTDVQLWTCEKLGELVVRCGLGEWVERKL